jgi:hypothetical protein
MYKILASILAEAFSGTSEPSSHCRMRFTPLPSRKSKNFHVSILIQDFLKYKHFPLDNLSGNPENRVRQ